MITSTSNPQVKMIRKLKDKKERQQTGLYYMEGIRIVLEALQMDMPLKEIILAPELITGQGIHEIYQEVQRLQIPVTEVSGDVFRSFSVKEGPQGVAAIAHQQWTDLKELIPVTGDVWVALDSVADPGNLGTIMRTVDAIGGKGVILLDQSTDPYDSTSIRASMGALFHLQIIKANLAEFIQWKLVSSISIIGTSDSAEMDYHDFRFPDPIVLLMGSERMGLQPQHYKICEQVVRIPMVGRSDSLNLAIATAVIVYEIFNQRRTK